MSFVPWFFHQSFFKRRAKMPRPKEERQFTPTAKCLVNLWNKHHIPAGVIFLAPDGPRVIAPENMRECLNNILRTDPRLAEAIDNDSDVLREMGEDEYFSLDQHDNPVRAFRAAGDPGLLPFPPDYLTQKEMWRYLADEAEKEQIREKRSKTLTFIAKHKVIPSRVMVQYIREESR